MADLLHVGPTGKPMVFRHSVILGEHDAPRFRVRSVVERVHARVFGAGNTSQVSLPGFSLSRHIRRKHSALDAVKSACL